MNEAINSAVRFYRPSGKAPLVGLLLLAATALIAVPLLGFIYGAVVMFNPSITLDIILVVFYPFLVAILSSWAIRKGRIRNAALTVGAGIFFGVMAEYAGWVGWLAYLARDVRFVSEFLYPPDIFYWIGVVAEHGAWSIQGVRPTGGELYFLWLIEACIVIGGTTLATNFLLQDIPYCEESDRWADKRSQVGAFTPIANPSEFKAAIRQGNFSVFQALKPSPSRDRHYTALRLFECPDCHNFYMLNVVDVRLPTGGGRSGVKRKKIVTNLLISPMQLASLRKLAEQDGAE